MAVVGVPTGLILVIDYEAVSGHPAVSPRDVGA